MRGRDRVRERDWDRGKDWVRDMYTGIDAVSNVWLVQNIILLREVSDWSIVKISILPHSLTRSRGQYLRVVGIHSDG